MEKYFGTYRTFLVPSKDEAASLLGADNLVGDLYDLQLEFQDGEHRAWLVNRFDKRVGFFDADFSRKLSILHADGMVCKAILSYVARTESTDSEGDSAGNGAVKNDSAGESNSSSTPRGASCPYWGEMAVVCYNPAHEREFASFLSSVSKKMEDNVRLRVDFDSAGVKKIIDSDGTWVPEQTVPMPGKSKGTTIMKDHRSISDKLIEQGRMKNPGCYAISWAFLIAVALGLSLIIKTLLGL